MNEANLAAWTAKLRDPEMKQGRETLIQPAYDEDGETVLEDRYCCLGVGCLVADPEDRWAWTGEDLPPVSFHRWLGITPRTDEPQSDVQVNLPFPFRGGTLPWGDIGCSTLNDGLGLTFSQIADLLDYFGVAG